ncbi:hypothetical protein GP2143_14576 [marine gamma proteobacterium HTCC2143]|uniref:Uncharacterized protein n=1 Tax=marine gamma proteobacterium HTCC2143 TaxID=247633 RepID=A0Y8N5_9GAMM|nr:hypothetical protein GP2143_14576 [marine gamma proteobacterium HTCC2143]
MKMTFYFIDYRFDYHLTFEVLTAVNNHGKSILFVITGIARELTYATSLIQRRELLMILFCLQ